MILAFAGIALITAAAVPWYAWAHGFDGYTWGMFALFASLSNLAITAGYHRLWSHKTFKAHPLVRSALALLTFGSLRPRG